MSYPILYSFRRCPYAMRARMAIYASGLTCELREVVLRDKPSQMLDLSPKATVPVLQLSEGRVLEESLDIMRWALSQNDPHGWLAADKRCTDHLIAQNDRQFKIYLDGYKYAARYENVDPLEQRTQAEVILTDLNNRIEQAGFLCGEIPSLADFAIFPFIRQFAFVDMAWFRATSYEALIAWLDYFLRHEVFLNVMDKYPQWHADEENSVLFPQG